MGVTEDDARHVTSAAPGPRLRLLQPPKERMSNGGACTTDIRRHDGCGDGQGSRCKRSRQTSGRGGIRFRQRGPLNGQRPHKPRSAPGRVSGQGDRGERPFRRRYAATARTRTSRRHRFARGGSTGERRLAPRECGPRIQMVAIQRLHEAVVVGGRCPTCGHRGIPHTQECPRSRYRTLKKVNPPEARECAATSGCRSTSR